MRAIYEDDVVKLIEEVINDTIEKNQNKATIQKRLIYGLSFLKTANEDTRLCINCDYLEIGNPQMFCCFYDAPCNGINDWCYHFKKRNKACK